MSESLPRNSAIEQSRPASPQRRTIARDKIKIVGASGSVPAGRLASVYKKNVQLWVACVFRGFPPPARIKRRERRLACETMKLGYYHYFFKQRGRRNAPRLCHNITSLLKAYIEYDDVDWKTKLETEDGEKLLLTPTDTSGVFMLVATRHQEIIKAIHTGTLSCADLSDRLQADEAAGFAAYFTTNARSLALASTLRGPRTAALDRFVNYIIRKLGAADWQFHLQVVGSSLTMEQAKGMAFVSRTTIQVGQRNPAFQKLRELFAADSDDIGSFEITIRNRKSRNLRDVVRKIAEEAKGEDLDKMRIRAKAALDDALSDYFVEEEGKLSEEIGTGTEEKMTRVIRMHFARNTELNSHIDQTMKESVYEDRRIPELSRLGDVAHWREYLRGE